MSTNNGLGAILAAILGPALQAAAMDKKVDVAVKAAAERLELYKSDELRERVQTMTREEKDALQLETRTIMQNLHDAACIWLQSFDERNPELAVRAEQKAQAQDEIGFDFGSVFGEGLK